MTTTTDTDLSALTLDAFDRRAYALARTGAPALDALATDADARGAGTPDAWNALLGDTFGAMFKSAPAVRENAPPAPAALMTEMMSGAEYAKMREITRLDEIASTLATIELGETLRGKLPEDEQERRTVLRRAMRAARQKTEETLEAAAALGCGRDKGEIGRTDTASVAALANKLANDERLKRIARLAGRMNREAMARHARRVEHGRNEVCGVQLSDDVARAVPSELAMLAHPVLRREFYRRVAERQLMTYAMRGVAGVARGPIVACVDISGSMSGEPEVWAKAVALGLLRIAREERRDFALILFSNDATTYDLGRDPTPDAILAALAPYCGGGTDFVKPLESALAIIESPSRAELRKADVVFITDGEAGIPDASADRIREHKARLGTRLWSVFVGMSEHTNALTALSDGATWMSDLGSDTGALNLAFGI